MYIHIYIYIYMYSSGDRGHLRPRGGSGCDLGPSDFPHHSC